MVHFKVKLSENLSEIKRDLSEIYAKQYRYILKEDVQYATIHTCKTIRKGHRGLY